LAELTALAQIPWLDLRGPTSNGERGGTGRKDKGREDGRRWDLLLRRGGEWKEKRRGEGLPPNLKPNFSHGGVF